MKAKIKSNRPLLENHISTIRVPEHKDLEKCLMDLRQHLYQFWQIKSK